MIAATKQTLGALDTSKIKRLVVVRRKGALRIMKDRPSIEHFIRNHSQDEVAEQDGKLCSVQPGMDYQSLIVNIDIH